MMKIYFISLEQDKLRRIKLNGYFPKYYSQMHWIKAINGKNLLAKEYYDFIISYLKKYNRIITPSEVGCTLSHIKALEDFLETCEEYILILEDDIFGTDQDIERIFNIVKKLDKKSILLCGGQTSSANKNYQLGKKSHIEGVTKISQFSYKYMYGTCCYVLTRESALQILNMHNKSLNLADNWSLFFLNTPFQIYYTNILQHPDDRTDSHLQKERLSLIQSIDFYQRIKSGHFFIKNFSLLKNYLIIGYLFLIGYRRVR